MGYFFLLTTLFLQEFFAKYNASSALESIEFTSSFFLRLATQILIVTLIFFHSLFIISKFSTNCLILSEKIFHHSNSVPGKIIINSSPQYLANTSFHFI